MHFRHFAEGSKGFLGHFASNDLIFISERMLKKTYLRKFFLAENLEIKLKFVSVNRYGIWLSNEQLFLIIAQGAAKLWHVNVGGAKKIQPWTHSNLLLSKRATSKAIFSDLQL